MLWATELARASMTSNRPDLTLAEAQAAELMAQGWEYLNADELAALWGEMRALKRG